MNPINKTRFLLLLLFLVTSVCSYAQEFPVQVNTTLLPPYSLYLSDYTSPERSSLQIQLQLRELDRPEYKVKLRVTIEGMGITLRTKGSYIPQPIVLQGGMPEILTGADIKNYLNPDNLDFSGISKQEFTRKGTFPEGFYTFKIEVIDYVRNVVVSNPGFANAWIILNDPPIINLPFNDDKVIATDPQNVQFSWTPRHTASMNAAFDTEYEFTLVELYPVSRNPNDAIRVSRPIFQTITSATSLNYGITETLLIPGRKYAFRVRALDTSGRDLFKNQGYSEVFVFQFGDACIPPTNIKAEPLDDVRFKLTWDTQDIHTSYSVQYRKKGSNAWSDQNVNSNSVIIPGLQGNTEYEYQVRGGCGTIQGEYSPLASVTTLEGNPNEFICGASPGDIEIKTVPLQKDLLIDDVIKTADFDIIISEVEANADGSYKGKGYAQLPWLNFVSVKVKFSNIKVNEDYRVFSGNVTTLYSKAKADAYMEKLKEMGEDAPKENKTPDQFVVEDTISFAGEIKEISVDVSRGVVVIVDASGETTEVSLEKNEDGNFKETLVKDSNGDSWLIDKNGNVTEGPSNTAPAAIASESEIDFTIAFAASENQLYGFDQKEDYGTHYETVTIRSNQYTIPWKSVETGRQDEVLAKAIGKNEFPGFVGFKTATGEVLKQPSSNAGEKKVFAPGGAADDEQPLTAYVLVKSEDGKEDKEIEVARLNIKTYDKITRKVVVVPVNNASTPDALTLQNELNKIYQQPVVQWEVEVAPVYQVDQEAITGLDSQQSDWLASFPDKMQDFNKAYKKKSSSFDKDAYHIFLVKGSGSSRAGFMPFKRKYGYIFTDNLGGENVIKTIAHELAHGAFRLRHTFSTEAFVAAKATTNNLMDYKGGTTLKKYQWDLVHHPESMIGWFEDDEEQESVVVTNIEVLDQFKNADGSLTFMTPSGRVVSLPSSTDLVVFSTGDNWKSDESFEMTPIGSLIAFRSNGKYYQATRIQSGSTFLGYRNGEEYYKDVFSKSLGAHKAIVGIPCLENLTEGSKITFLTKQIELTKSEIEENYSGQGELKSHNFLALLGLINFDGDLNIEGSRKIYGQILPALGNEAIDFLEKNKSYAGCGTGTSFYVFTHAHLINKFPQTYIAFRESEKSHVEILYEVARSLPSASGYELSSRPVNEFTLKSSIEFWADKSVKVYKEFDDVINKINGLKTETNADVIANIVNEYYALIKLFGAINLETRKHILQKLLEGNVKGYWLSLGNNKENTFIQVLTSTPEDQQRDILSLFKINSNALLYSALNKLDLGPLDEFLNTLVYWNSKYFPYTQVFEGGLYATTERETRYFFINKSQVGLFETAMFGQVNASVNIVNFGNTRSFSNKPVGEPSYFKWFCNLSPFDYVTLEFGDEFDFTTPDGSGKLEKGTTITVPVIWAYWFQKRHHQQLAFRALRVALDVVAIATAPYSGGTTLMISEIVVAGVDIAVTLSEDYLNNSETGREVLDTWNSVVATYGAALGGYFLWNKVSSAVTKFTFNVDNIPGAYSRLKNNSSTIAANFKASLTSLANKLQGTQPLVATRILSELRTIDLLEWVKSIQDNLKLQVRNLTAAVIIKGGIEYKIGMYSINLTLGKAMLSEIRWADDIAISEYEFKAELQNATFIDQRGSLVQVGNLNIYEKLDGSGFYASIVSKDLHRFISPLNGSIKSTINDLLKVGLVTEFNANSIIFKNSKNETVAIVYNNKITPSKWAWEVKASSTTKIQTSEGYIILKQGDDIKFDLGFKEGRKLEAREVNDYLVRGQGKDLDGQPYWAGTQVDELVLGRKGEIIYFVEDFNNGVPKPGQYASKDPVATIKELREKLAVKEAWKQTANEPTLRSYRVKAELRARSGIIGRQSDNGLELPGGGHQYEVIDYLGSNWAKYLDPIGIGTKLKGTKLADRLDEFANINKKLANFNDAKRQIFLDDFADAGDDVFAKLEANSNLVDSWKVLDDAGETQLSGRIKDIEFVDDYLKRNLGKASTVAADIKNKGWQKWVDDVTKGGVRSPNWVEVLDIRAKILARKSHVLEIESITTKANGQKGFTGCHSKVALDDYAANNSGAKIEFRNKNLDATSGVYEAEPVIKMPNGDEYVKLNNNGKSTFFPDNWNEAKVLDEVEYAIQNNQGRFPNGAPNEYYGFSTDGKVKIHFYLNPNGNINSFFPSLAPL